METAPSETVSLETVSVSSFLSVSSLPMNTCGGGGRTMESYEKSTIPSKSTGGGRRKSLEKPSPVTGCRSTFHLAECLSRRRGGGGAVELSLSISEAAFGADISWDFDRMFEEPPLVEIVRLLLLHLLMMMSFVDLIALKND